MGLFGKLFEKKICDICGGEIGLLGNRKLADGNLCKNCAALLSPWMTDRRQSTVDEIRRHIAYRRANAGIVPLLEPTRVFGHGMRLYIDDARRLFFVTQFTDWQRRNPDVVPFDKVRDCSVNVREHREELFDRAPDGRRVPFDPRRFDFTYEFRVHIDIDSPFFDEIDFELSGDRPHARLTTEYRSLEIEANRLQHALRPDLYPLASFPPLPVAPRPVHPVSPAPVRPGAAGQEPVVPEPVRPAPVRPGAVGQGPVVPEPVRPAPVRPGAAGQGPVVPGPVKPAAPEPSRPIPSITRQNAEPPRGPQQPGPAQPQMRPVPPQQPVPPQAPQRPVQPGTSPFSPGRQQPQAPGSAPQRDPLGPTGPRRPGDK